MAKKKKTQLKPVNRGFTTTSQPKKVVEIRDEPKEPEQKDTRENPPVDSTENSSTADASSHPSQQEPTLSTEEQALQDLVEKHQERVEKDINRTIKAIEQERRLSNTLQRLEFDPVLKELVLQLAVDEDSTRGLEKDPVVDGPVDKALHRLAVTYGVLRRLGFAEERVVTCLRSISGVDLDEAVDWLCLHCPEGELKPTELAESAESNLNAATVGQSSGSSSGNVAQSPHNPSASPPRLDPNAPAFIPGFRVTTPAPNPQFTSDLDDTDVAPAGEPEAVAVVEETTTQVPLSTEIGSTDADADDNPIAAYVRVRMQIDELTTRRRPGETRRIDSLKSLRMRLEDIRGDYLFDEKMAEEAYQSERKKADADALLARLRGIASMPKASVPQPEKASPKASTNANATPSDIFEQDESDDSNGGMFDLLEDMPTSEISDQGTSITVRDLAPPKNWSGRTPKLLLQETVLKLDRYAAVTYRPISGSSRAKRATVSIHWGGGMVKEWSMEDVACYDMLQAEQYVATIALHALTYPTLEGFALGANSTASAKTSSFRLLPPVYRDLWSELEDKRKTSDDAFNRSVWARLKDILQSKMQSAPEPSNKALKQDNAWNKAHRNRNHDGFDQNSDEIVSAFKARQESPAYKEMLVQRNQLPISAYRHEIIKTLETSQVMVLSGETGCGKSTQLPAFILEDHLSRGKHCKIYCTEPRRISAISLAQRVSVELGEPPGSVGTKGSLVGYSIRLESNTSKTTRLAYVTNGIALRMLESGSGADGDGIAFDEITHIIIDEVHERSIESDFLLIVLKSLLQQRPDLRVVLMSATVDADKLSNYFGGCPTVHVPGRTFPVDVRFLEDAVELTQWKISATSPNARRMKDKFNRNQRVEWSEETAPAEDDDDEETDQTNVKLERRYSPQTVSTVNLLDERYIPYELIMVLLEKLCFDASYQEHSSAILIFMPGLGEIRRLSDMLAEHPIFGNDALFYIFPLHSLISSEQQTLVFNVPPEGVRKIVIATNIAETGITIPDITCVIDSGKHREMRFDEKRQISRLIETFIAKSNAAQRRGRAGRVRSGLCFHLFTKARYEKMADHPDPEMMRLSLSDLALRIKIMKVKIGSSIEDVLSRALDPPLSVNIQRAVSALVEVRALTPNEEITPMGLLLSKLPTDVHLGKFLLIATIFRCLDPALTIVAALNSKSPFVEPLGLEDEARRAKMSFRVENSDFLTIHNAFTQWRNFCNIGTGEAHRFCRQKYLSFQNLQQIEELRQQFIGYLVDSRFIRVDQTVIRELSRARYNRGRPRFVMPPTEYNCNSNNNFVINAALCAGLYPKILSIDPSKEDLRTITNNQAAAFHPSSVNFQRKPREFGVNYLAFFTLMQSRRLYAWETTPVDDLALLLLCGEAEFKLLADMVQIDRKIRYRIDPKTGIALKHLRNALGRTLATQFRAKPLTESQVLWNDLAFKALGHVKDREEEQTSTTIVLNRPT
ncbi:P-loop containing nucleoside triphosphate hydrolase protein [Panus rudis PR-1116 ss-1]|nr:P-loop containing nucleoside triphosphate hydrolase protein [Panus rudis PR-1116 ss-1]